MRGAVAAVAVLALGLGCSGPGEPEPNLPDYPVHFDAAMATTTPVVPDAGAPLPPPPPDAAPPPPDAKPVPVAKVAKELTKAKGLSGNVAIGPTEIVHHPTRDAIALFYQDGFEGEPGIGWLLVLDAKTNKAYAVDAWDFAFSADGSKVAYSIGHRVRDDEADPPRDLTRKVAKLIGVKSKSVSPAVFEDGNGGGAFVTQPVVLDLDRGKSKRLKLVGGGTLAEFGGGIVAVARPAYYAFSEEAAEDDPDRAAAVPVMLNIKKRRWDAVKAADRDGALAALTAQTQWPDLPHTLPDNALIAVTRDGSLGAVVVDPSAYAVVGARLE
jgi:hypothetical protein